MRTVLHPLDDAADVELVTRHQSGDPAAFAELYTRHHRRLVRFCDRLVENPHLAEELAHDAFLRAYTSMEHLGGPRRFYPWIAVIARRLVIDALRKSSRISLEAHVEIGIACGADEIVVQRLHNDDVLVALEQVLARHRAVLAMRDVDELSYQEIADELGLPLTAVAPLLHRARSALRREYLLLTGDRVAALAPLAALFALGRRSRDRMASLLSWLPEPAVIGVPAAIIVIGAFNFWGGNLSPHSDVSLSHSPDTAAIQRAETSGGSTARAAQSRPSTSGAVRWDYANYYPVVPDPVPETRADGPRGFGRGGYGQQDRERVQQEARRMPYYVEIGPAGIGWDPDDDRRRIEEFATGSGGN